MLRSSHPPFSHETPYKIDVIILIISHAGEYEGDTAFWDIAPTSLQKAVTSNPQCSWTNWEKKVIFPNLYRSCSPVPLGVCMAATGQLFI
jgi:hypothetical protein